MDAKGPPTFKGRNFGILLLVGAQTLVGFIHVVFGLWLLSSPKSPPLTSPNASIGGLDIYSTYTLIFGLLAIGLAAMLWLQKSWGWIGTISIFLFVIIVDSLTLLNLPSIPGIPKFAGFGEISYSVLTSLYLIQKHVRKAYRIIF